MNGALDGRSLISLVAIALLAVLELHRAFTRLRGRVEASPPLKLAVELAIGGLGLLALAWLLGQRT
jgi:hypothetical protein